MRLYMDQRLIPPRSLSRRGVILVMAPLVVTNLVFAAFLFHLGGILAPPFLALDVIGVGLAFWFSFRSARQVEHVQVTADEVRVTRESPRASRTIWVSAPIFTRLERERPGRHDGRVRLVSKGKGVTLGAALAPRQRADFAEALDGALTRARAERW